MHVCAFVRMYVSTCVRMYVYTYARMYVYTYVCLPANKSTLVCHNETDIFFVIKRAHCNATYI